jgi:hypothetical protein
MGLIYNGSDVTDVIYDGADVDTIIYNGVEVWSAEPNPIPTGNEYVDSYDGSPWIQEAQTIGNPHIFGYGIGASGGILASFYAKGDSGTASMAINAGPFGLEILYKPTDSTRQYITVSYPGGSSIVGRGDVDSKFYGVWWDFNNDEITIRSGRYANELSTIMTLPFTERYRNEWQNASCYWVHEYRSGNADVAIGRYIVNPVIRTS